MTLDADGFCFEIEPTGAALGLDEKTHKFLEAHKKLCASLLFSALNDLAEIKHVNPENLKGRAKGKARQQRKELEAFFSEECPIFVHICEMLGLTAGNVAQKSLRYAVELSQEISERRTGVNKKRGKKGKTKKPQAKYFSHGV